VVPALKPLKALDSFVVPVLAGLGADAVAVVAPEQLARPELVE
jgi:hypothetical protein